MATPLDRRTLLGSGAAAAAGLLLPQGPGSRPGRTVGVGVIGTGRRGTGLLRILLGFPEVVVPAVCDIDPVALERALSLVAATGRPRPAGYGPGEEAWRELLRREDLEAVIVATPWRWHAAMGVAAMKAGKYVGLEVPAAQTLAECWELVDACEATGVPCMMLENWSFRRDNLAVLRLIRQGLFGEMVHCHCAHTHDCIDHWFFDRTGQMRWGGEYLVTRNCDQYPTHSLGPVLSWLGLNGGDRFLALASTATSSRGIQAYFRRRFGPDHPNARRAYRQGDIVTSVATTARGRTVAIHYDMQLPRPYDNRWLVQGTLGLYDEARSSVYITGRSPRYHEWEPFAPYQEEFDHPWWRELAAATGGHGGTDLLELRLFLAAVRDRGPTPLDVYDSVTMSAVVALSGDSIARGGVPVPFPDFTRGRWEHARSVFAGEA